MFKQWKSDVLAENVGADSKIVLGKSSVMNADELASVARGLLQEVYANPVDFRRLKAHIQESYQLLQPTSRSVFNLILNFDDSEIESDLIKIAEVAKTSPKLFSAILAGPLRKNEELVSRIIREYLIEELKSSEYLSSNIFYYFKARGWSNERIGSTLDLKRTSQSNQALVPRVALLVSGQVRGIESAVASWRKVFDFSGVETDVFVSTWSKSYEPNSLSWPRVAPPEILPRIQTELKDLDESQSLELLSSFLPPRKVTSRYLISVLSDLPSVDRVYADIEDEENFKSFTNPMKMYFKMQKAFRMSEMNAPYDLYIRIRPDIVLQSEPIVLRKIVNEVASECKVLAHYPYVYEYYGFGVDDKIGFMSYRTAQIYHSVWEKDRKSGMTGHINLAARLSSADVQVESIPNLKVSFVNYNLPDPDML